MRIGIILCLLASPALLHEFRIRGQKEELRHITKILLTEIANAIRKYKSDMGEYPLSRKSNEKGFSSNSFLNFDLLVQNGSKEMCASESIKNNAWHGPYIDSATAEFLLDPWEREIEYFSASGEIFLRSLGPNGIKDSCEGNVWHFFSTADDICVEVGEIGNISNSFCQFNQREPQASPAVPLDRR